ncbi:type VII secretion protein EccB [Actinomycetospora termitidis]|uniref:Type VII secretion protein EccB n=1 Tax=Actinomycetospora termitidis TaxID=3053470 RepID=A0ABT7MCG5_9PSEU|nr:type VII secretion protein EccB [Actinomycetospora sp. Odt1-22]MDL5158156.1 type VII secretion protein EccB [Actinomycetospora sp. Odt1-22]
MSRPAPPATASQVRAQRGATRRLDQALVERDPHAERDPERTRRRAVTVGAVVAALGLVAAAVVGLVRGDADWRAATIVRGVPSGTLYVVARDPDRLVPTTDLASARLLAAGVDAHRADPAEGLAPADPTPVRDDALTDVPRTVPLGLAGAPSVLPDTASAPVPDVWAVCDAPAAGRERPVVLAGYPDLGQTVTAGEALLLRGDDGRTWLVSEGRRAAIDPAQGAVVRALDIAGEPARPAGPALLGTLPEGAPLVPPQIVGAGLAPADPATRALGLPVGTVARVAGDPVRLVVVLPGGVQEVPAVVAELTRFATPGADARVAEVPAPVVDGLPRVVGIDLDAYPRAFPRVLGEAEAPVVCGAPTIGAGTTLTVAGTVPSPVPPTPVADPGAVGSVRIAGAGAYVVPVGPGEPVDPGRGVVVDQVGRVLPVAGRDAAAALGLGAPRPAPRSVVDLLPRGPVLDLVGARTLR